MLIDGVADVDSSVLVSELKHDGAVTGDDNDDGDGVYEGEDDSVGDAVDEDAVLNLLKA